MVIGSVGDIIGARIVDIRATVRKGIELWGRILSGERLVCEQCGRGYSIGVDPPYVRMCAHGRWVDALGGNPIMLCRG